MIKDFIFLSLEKAIIKSYADGDLDSSLNQLECSLSHLAEFYDPAFFHSLPPSCLLDEKRRLLEKIQSAVDQEIGLHILRDYNDTY